MQSRLFDTPAAPVVANSAPTEPGETISADDDSFGTQLVLKNQERPRPFTLFGDVSGFYTTNVDLTPDHTRGDAFVVGNIGGAYRPTISRQLFGDVSFAATIFRYDRASELDFERLSAGAGLSWLVPHGRGIVAFGRYDFVELLNKHSDELLQDHTFTIGAQRTFSFGRPQSVTFGISGIGGISSPQSQQREQGALSCGYHLQISRSLSADLLYRYAAQFYTEGGRTDHNQIGSLIIGWTGNRWTRIDATLSIGRNDSNRSEFTYDVLNLGGALRAIIRF